ncbi:UDP-2,3-diacylglucosamine diphosphatase LpxI [soil metagenome]
MSARGRWMQPNEPCQPPGDSYPAVVDQQTLGIIAGSGIYPVILARSARAAGVHRIVVAAFENETSQEMVPLADHVEWMRVGQLGRMIRCFEKQGTSQAIMAGQIAPKNLWNLRPDLQALLLLGRLKKKNAATIFGAIADELAAAGVTLLPATTYLDDLLPKSGWSAGPAPGRRQEEDVRYGFAIAKEVSRLDIGQTVVVKKGTVLAVEAFEGTNECLRRGGAQGKGEAVMVKVSKPKQDMRFDVPVIGMQTMQVAREAGIRVLAVEAGATLLLEMETITDFARAQKMTVMAVA